LDLWAVCVDDAKALDARGGTVLGLALWGLWAVCVDDAKVPDARRGTVLGLAYLHAEVRKSWKQEYYPFAA
jgi:hypothetical protein